jgi:glycerol-3-phosphate O-acyltransferase
MTLGDVLDRMEEYRDLLRESNAKVVRADRDVRETWSRAMLMFRMRRTVHLEGERVVVMARQRPLLEYYANSVRHLLPHQSPADQLMTPIYHTGEIEAAFKLKPPPAPKPP